MKATDTRADFSCMFCGCSSLESVPALDTANGEDFSYMFSNCSSLESVPALDTAKGKRFAYIFDGCSSLRLLNMKDFGKNAEARSLNLTPLRSWGAAGGDGFTAEDALASVVNTFKSFHDREAAGYAPVKVLVAKETAALLESAGHADVLEELAGKGYAVSLG